jgi:hypothetical protein
VDSSGGRALTDEVGATKSRMTESDTTSLVFPVKSRNWA